MSEQSSGFVLNMQDPYVRVMYQLTSARAQLGIEINTGLKYSRGSVMAAVRSWRILDPATAELPEPRYLMITCKGTKIGVWEDLDATIVWLGGESGNSARLVRKGSTEKINAAAQRRHERRIAKILAGRTNSNTEGE